MVSRLVAMSVVSVACASLAAQSEEFGAWIQLFDGSTTRGWVNAREDAGSPVRWRVEDGALTIGSGGHDLCTEAQFESYELELEYKVPPKGNSGVYLRGAVEVQILDSFEKKAQNAKLEQSDAGAVYSAGAPIDHGSKPAGEWNRFRILHIGNRVTVYLNDVLVQDNLVAPNETPGNMLASKLGQKLQLEGKRGPIMLQGDHGVVWYRGLRARRLLEPGAGWKALWNGKDLSEFNARGDQRAKDGLRWKVEGSAFTNGDSTGSKGHDLWTGEPFGNFLVHYEYKSGPGDANSGFYLRDQWEIQIERKNDLANKHMDGDLYSIYSVAQLARNKPDQWNHMDVKLVDNKVWVWQNGKLIHDGRELTRRTDSNTPTKPFSKAPFKLQGDHGRVAFTNLFIRPLPDSPAAK